MLKKCITALIKKMVLAWDADFTKLTPSERQRLDIADAEINNNDFVSHGVLTGKAE